MITRRQVMAAAAAVPVAGALGVGTTAWSWWDRPAGAGLQALSEEEHAFAQALAEAWMPPGGRPELSGADARLGDFLDAVIAGMVPETARELKLLLHALDHLPIPTHAFRFATLSREARTAILSGWMDHPLWPVRDGVSGVMILLAMGWTTHPDVVPTLRPQFPCGYGR